MDNDYKNPWENENLKNPWGQQQKVEDNKSFFKGMVIGVTISLTLFIAILVGNILINKEYIETDDNKQMLENAGLDSEGSTGEDETGSTSELNLDKVFNKAEYIKKLIDEYYYYEGDMVNIEQGLYAGMVAALGDPYSVYYDKESFKAMMESTVGTYCGIGVVVQQNMETMTIMEEAVEAAE